MKHLDKSFQRLSKYDVTLNSKKSFLKYSFIMLLKQVMNVFEMIISEEKMIAIVKLFFSKTFKNLKTYLKMIDWMRNYVLFYVQVSNFLQQRKILLLKSDSTKKNFRKKFSFIKLLKLFTDKKYEIYFILQNIFNKSSFLIHFASNRWLLINVNVFKQKDFEAMIFHVKKNSENADFKKFDIQSIMFLNKKLSVVEMKYWSTELKVVEIVWIVRKIKHLIESCKSFSVLIFTNHVATAEIVSQISLIITNIDKFNLRLIRVFQFLSTLSIKIKIKSKKLHIIFDAFSRLKSFAFSEKTFILKNLNDMNLNVMIAMFIAKRNISQWDVKFHHIHETLNAHFEKSIILMKMNEEFSAALKKTYDSDDQWRKIRVKLKTRIDRFDIFDGIKFVLKNFQIYYASNETILRLCIFWKLKKRIYALIHDSNHHCGFHKAYVRIIDFLYIRHLTKRFRRYIKYCKKCMKNQIMRHASYEKLKFINIMTLFFHIIIIDFIVSMPKTSDEMNAIFFTIDKFFKRISLVAEKITWNAFEWVASWLVMLQRKNWKLSRIIISNRNFKFIAAFWKFIFNHLKIVFLFITAYHFQTDEQSKKTNQIVKIVLRYFFMKKNITDFFKFLLFIQIIINNSINASTKIFFNEILYDFKILKTIDFLNNDLTKARADDENFAIIIKKKRFRLRKKIEKSIFFAQIMTKLRYDSKHNSLKLKKKNKVFIRLHKEYIQSNLKNKKFNKQRVDSIIIFEKIDRLIYKLNIFSTWKIHFVVFVIYFEPVFFEKNSYEKKMKKSESMKIEKKNDADVYEMKKIITKRKIYIERKRRRRTHSEFRMKWTE